MEAKFIKYSSSISLLILVISIFWTPILWSLIIVVPIIVVAYHDIFIQKAHAIKYNFPVIGHFRYISESMGNKVRQYFVESDTDGSPVNRNDRSVIYARAKEEIDNHPFGTQTNVYENGYEWINHSMYPFDVKELNQAPKVRIGSPDCMQPYWASIYGIGAMSYGALSQEAILALNGGAKLGGFFHNTGEGGISPYHLKHGGDLVWQIGPGGFGARTPSGDFSEELFSKNANLPQVKMIEIKLSQGAKPGHGGILPASKNTPEIAKIRGVEPGVEIVSPSAFPTFSNSREMLEFINKLRRLSKGKPIGIKMCIGRRSEVIDLCRAMVYMEAVPDFITIDGGEGGTGAAPLEYSDSVGTPLNEGLAFMHDMLVGFGLRDKIKIIASGKIASGFEIIRTIALGADLCLSARGMMMALGCIQALECHKNTCPTGIATQDIRFREGLHIENKTTRVYNYHKNTVHIALDLLSSVGIKDFSELSRKNINRRISQTNAKRYDEIFPNISPGSLLNTSKIANHYKILFKEEAVV